MTDPLILKFDYEYEEYYRAAFCNTVVLMPLANGESMRVYFSEATFRHAFYESSGRRGEKDIFSLERACRMPFIPVALSDPFSMRKYGWNKKRDEIDYDRCVCIVADDDFVVVLRLGINQRGNLKANFVTCYLADRSIGKILDGPDWNEVACRQRIESKKKGTDSHTLAQHPRPR